MYPKRLLLADARRRGVPILPLDVNASGVTHRIELVSDVKGLNGAKGQQAPERGEVWGLRLALCDVHGISEDRKSTRLNSSHVTTSYAAFCLPKKRSPAHALR